VTAPGDDASDSNNEDEEEEGELDSTGRLFLNLIDNDTSFPG
jgi:hypothetical protein